MKKILIVDDDPDMLALVRIRLSGKHYTLFFASGGEEGVRQAKQELPDLIIMDVMMPKMSGGDAVRVLKADPETQHIPVIFLTAVAASLPEGEEGTRVNVGGQFYPAISKPFDVQRLLSEIQRQLGERHPS